MFVFTPSSHPSAFPNWLDHSVQVHLHTSSIMASKSISKFTWSQCGEAVELDGSKPLINALPCLSQHPIGNHRKDQFWLKDHMNIIRGYDGVPSHMEPHLVFGSMEAQEQCVTNHTRCIDQWILGNIASDQELRKIGRVCHIIRWWLSTSESPKYGLPIAPSITWNLASPDPPPPQ